MSTMKVLHEVYQEGKGPDIGAADAQLKKYQERRERYGDLSMTEGVRTADALFVSAQKLFEEGAYKTSIEYSKEAYHKFSREACRQRGRFLTRKEAEMLSALRNHIANLEICDRLGRSYFRKAGTTSSRASTILRTMQIGRRKVLEEEVGTIKSEYEHLRPEWRKNSRLTAKFAK